MSDQSSKWGRGMAQRGFLPLAKRLSFAVAGHVFGHPAEYHAIENIAEPAMDYAPHFLLYNRTWNPWGPDRDSPKRAKETFAVCNPRNRSKARTAHTEMT